MKSTFYVPGMFDFLANGYQNFHPPGDNIFTRIRDTLILRRTAEAPMVKSSREGDLDKLSDNPVFRKVSDNPVFTRGR